MDQGYGTDLSFRRRRKPLKPIDMQEPRMSYDDESSSTTAKAHSCISAHESKILRRRDKAFAGMASRSHSQPRPEDDLFQLMQTNKRSLSSPRHKEENFYEPPAPRHHLTEDDRLTRLEKNLQRFEEERRYFDKERRMFEKEKREHKLRYRQMLDEDQRRKMLESYRKMGDRSSDADEKKRLIQCLRQSYRESSISQRPALIKPRYMEESSAMESSDTEHVPRPIPPPLPERKIVSRHSSLSPLRAEMMMGMEGVLQGEGIIENIYENLPVKKEPEPEKKEPVHELVSVPIERPDPPMKPVRRSVSKTAADRDTHIVKPVRRRSRVSVEPEVIDLIATVDPKPAKKSLFSFFMTKKKEKVDALTEDHQGPPVKKKRFFGKYRDVWDDLVADYPEQYKDYQLKRNQCCSHFLALILLCGFGGLLFRYTEGYLENIYKCEIRKVKRDFIDVLWSQSHNMR